MESYSEIVSNMLAASSELHRVENLGTCSESTIDCAKIDLELAEDNFEQMILEITLGKF